MLYYVPFLRHKCKKVKGIYQKEGSQEYSKALLAKI